MLRLSIAAALWLLPMVAFASEEPLTWGSVLGSRELWGSLVNFTVLALVLGWAIKNKVNPALEQRRQSVEENLAEAKRLKQAAEAKYAEYKARLEKLDSEVDDLRAEMVRAGEEERNRIITEAEQKASRMRRDAEFLIEQRFKQLREDLTQQAVAAAISSAEKLLKEQTSAADQERLAQTYLEALDDAAEEART